MTNGLVYFFAGGGAFCLVGMAFVLALIVIGAWYEGRKNPKLPYTPPLSTSRNLEVDLKQGKPEYEYPRRT